MPQSQVDQNGQGEGWGGWAGQEASVLGAAAHPSHGYKAKDCLKASPSLQLKMTQIEIIEKTTGKGSKFPSKKTLAKAVRSWRQGDKKQAARHARAKYPALHWMLGKLLGKAHHLGHHVARWLVLYIGRRWPGRPRPCRLCNGTSRGWQHFEAHVEALGAPSYAELDSMLWGLQSFL